MNEETESLADIELRDMLWRQASEIEWLMMHRDIDHESALWIRVRARRADRIVPFVVIVPRSQNAKNTAIAAMIMDEARHLFGKQR